MSKVNFSTSKGIIEELENSINELTEDKNSILLAQTRITGCKHAIQVFALSMEYAKIHNLKNRKLDTIELK